MNELPQEGAPPSRLMRTDVYPERQELPRPERDVRGPRALLERVALRCGWVEEGVILGLDPDALLKLVIRSFCGPGERVAIFEPSPASHKEAILSADVAYVDCGRTHKWDPRTDALAMVLSDGAIGVFVGDPNDPVDGLLASTEEILHIVNEAPSALFALVDARHQPSPFTQRYEAGPENIYLVRLWFSNKEPFYALLCDPERAQVLAYVRRENSGCPEQDLLAEREEGALFERANSHREALISSLRESGYLSSPSCMSGVFVMAPGTDQKNLNEGLSAQGYRTEAVQHYTWRSGVKVLGHSEGTA